MEPLTYPVVWNPGTLNGQTGFDRMPSRRIFRPNSLARSGKASLGTLTLAQTDGVDLRQHVEPHRKKRGKGVLRKVVHCFVFPLLASLKTLTGRRSATAKLPLLLPNGLLHMRETPHMVGVPLFSNKSSPKKAAVCKRGCSAALAVATILHGRRLLPFIVASRKQTKKKCPFA